MTLSCVLAAQFESLNGKCSDDCCIVLYFENKAGHGSESHSSAAARTRKTASCPGAELAAVSQDDKRDGNATSKASFTKSVLA